MDIITSITQENALLLGIIAGGFIALMRAYYQQISQILNKQPSLLMQPQMQSLIAEDFYPLLIDTIGKGVKQKGQRIKTYRRYSLVRQAEDIAPILSGQTINSQTIVRRFRNKQYRFILWLSGCFWHESDGLY
jgi:hypothetical protein